METVYNGFVCTVTGILGVAANPLGAGQSTIGIAAATNASGINDRDGDNLAISIYGISDVLTVAAIPEPGSFLFLTGVAICAIS